MDFNKKFPFQSNFKIESFGIKLKESEKEKEKSKDEVKDDSEEGIKKFPKKSKIETNPEVELGINQI